VPLSYQFPRAGVPIYWPSSSPYFFPLLT
jgi:hypothetical protein